MTKDIAIVGGGYSGIMTAVHLLDNARPGQISITLFDIAARPGRGLAYGTADDNLLLNVPAGNMSAFAHDQTHFVRYCQKIDPAFHEGTFVSRRIYGDYLQQILSERLTNSRNQVDTFHARVIAAKRLDSKKYELLLDNGVTRCFDVVVLALGHFEALAPLSVNSASRQTPFLMPNDIQALANIQSKKPVLIVGTGLTAADTIFKLSSFDSTRKFVAVSRRGLVSQVHRMNPKAPSLRTPAYLSELEPKVRTYLSTIRQEIRRCESEGGDWRDVINQLRPITPQIWDALSTFERRRFLRHIVPFWDVHRHRLAPMAHQRLENLIRDSQLTFMAGRMQSITADDEDWLVEVRHRQSGDFEVLRVSAILNCTGPNGDLSKINDPLIKQLLSDGLIVQDDLCLGIMVNDDYDVLDVNRLPVNAFKYVGPMLKAKYWEAIAVPELRQHTLRLAQKILE